MKCIKCSEEMKKAPFLLTSNPPQERYDCQCGHVEYKYVGGFHD